MYLTESLKTYLLRTIDPDRTSPDDEDMPFSLRHDVEKPETYSLIQCEGHWGKYMSQKQDKKTYTIHSSIQQTIITCAAKSVASNFRGHHIIIGSISNQNFLKPIETRRVSQVTLFGRVIYKFKLSKPNKKL